MGSQNSDDDSCWYWAGRTTYTEYANWAPGEPGNAGSDEDCVGLGDHGNPNAAQWHDCGYISLCDSGRLPPVCRIDLGVAMTGGDSLSFCPNDCHMALEHGHCDVDSNRCTCYSGWK